jgi:hypothetical protein
VFSYVQLTKYCTGDQMKEDEMGGACDTYIDVERHEGQGVDCRIILKCIFNWIEVR